jgi:hypothetical protein
MALLDSTLKEIGMGGLVPAKPAEAPAEAPPPVAETPPQGADIPPASEKPAPITEFAGFTIPTKEQITETAGKFVDEATAVVNTATETVAATTEPTQEFIASSVLTGGDPSVKVAKVDDRNFVQKAWDKYSPLGSEPAEAIPPLVVGGLVVAGAVGGAGFALLNSTGENRQTQAPADKAEADTATTETAKVEDSTKNETQTQTAAGNATTETPKVEDSTKNETQTQTAAGNATTEAGIVADPTKYHIAKPYIKSTDFKVIEEKPAQNSDAPTFEDSNDLKLADRQGKKWAAFTWFEKDKKTGKDLKVTMIQRADQHLLKNGELSSYRYAKEIDLNKKDNPTSDLLYMESRINIPDPAEYTVVSKK